MGAFEQLFDPGRGEFEQKFSMVYIISTFILIYHVARVSHEGVKQTTTAIAMLLNKRFNEQNNSCACAL